MVAGLFFSGRPHPLEGVPDGTRAHPEVGRPLALKGIGMLRNVPLKISAVQLAVAEPALAR